MTFLLKSLLSDQITFLLKSLVAVQTSAHHYKASTYLQVHSPKHSVAIGNPAPPGSHHYHYNSFDLQWHSPTTQRHHGNLQWHSPIAQLHHGNLQWHSPKTERHHWQPSTTWKPPSQCVSSCHHAITFPNNTRPPWYPQKHSATMETYNHIPQKHSPTNHRQWHSPITRGHHGNLQSLSPIAQRHHGNLQSHSPMTQRHHRQPSTIWKPPSQCVSSPAITFPNNTGPPWHPQKHSATMETYNHIPQKHSPTIGNAPSPGSHHRQ